MAETKAPDVTTGATTKAAAIKAAEVTPNTSAGKTKLKRNRIPTEPLDLDDFLDGDAEEFNTSTQRRSTLRDKCAAIKSETLAGKVKSGSDGRPVYLRIGKYESVAGANVAYDGLKNHEVYGETRGFEYKRQRVVEDGVPKSRLWARYIA